MLTSGDVVELDLGAPSGREAGFRHPAVVVTAQTILDAVPNVIQIVPMTTNLGAESSEVRCHRYDLYDVGDRVEDRLGCHDHCRMTESSLSTRWGTEVQFDHVTRGQHSANR